MKKNRSNQKCSEPPVPDIDVERPVSPVQACSSKHQVTPLKPKSKAPKAEIGEDVHSASTTPVGSRSKLTKSQYSPVGPRLADMYYLGCCSQEIPEVVWDYTSPKNGKGTGRRIKTMTIDDLLKNMRYSSQESHSKADTSSHLHLLEKWMELQNKSPAHTREVGRSPTKTAKKTSELLKTVQEMFKSITRTGNNSIKADDDDNCKSQVVQKQTDEKKADTCAFREFKRIETSSSVDVDEDSNNDFDSSDEFWGDVNENDNSLIVKATQDLETCLITQGLNLSRSLFKSSVLPATVPETCDSEAQNKNDVWNFDARTSSERKPKQLACVPAFPINSAVKEPMHEVETNYDISEFAENDWDSELDDSDWKDDVLVLDTLSQIPEEALKPVWNDNDLSKVTASSTPCRKDITKSPAKISCDKASVELSKNLSSLDSGICHRDAESPKESHLWQNSDQNQCGNQISADSAELFFEMDSEIFNTDDALLFEDDETMCMADMQIPESSSPKCTPEEIAQKKAEALKRLKEKQKK